MEIKVTGGKPASCLAVDLVFKYAELCIAKGAFALGLNKSQIHHDTFFWKLPGEDRGGYLAIRPKTRDLFLTSDTFLPFYGNFELNENELVDIAETMEKLLDQESWGAWSLTSRLNRAIVGICYKLSNPFRKVEKQMGQPLNENHFYLMVSLKNVVQRAIEAGNEKLRLSRSRVVGDKLYLRQGADQYLVLWPSATGPGNDFVSTATGFESELISVCISSTDEIKIRGQIRAWLTEAGL